MSNDEESPPDVPVLCPECGTESRIPLPDVGEAIERHNEQLHDGEDVAQVDPDVREHVADLVANELGLVE